MSTHIIHPDSHEHGLADGCPRCGEHAAHPFESLDIDNLAMIVARVRARYEPRSSNEAGAMRRVEEAMRHADVLAAIEQRESQP